MGNFSRVCACAVIALGVSNTSTPGSIAADANTLAQNSSTGGNVNPAVNTNPSTGNPGSPQTINPNVAGPSGQPQGGSAASSSGDSLLRPPPQPGAEVQAGMTAPSSQNIPTSGSAIVDTPPDPRVPGAGPASGPSQKLLPPDTLPLGVDQYANTPQTQVVLKGPNGQFVQFVDELTYNKPCVDCVGIQVKIKNDSSAPIIVDGDRAQANNAGKQLQAMSEDRAMTQSGGSFTAKQKLALGAAAVATLGLAEPILQDHFSTSKTDFPISYGTNETRRRLENRRLSRRVVLPGEDTDGILFFPGDSISFDKITIPIQTYPQGLAVGNIDINAEPGKGTFSKTVIKPGDDKAQARAERKEAKTGGYGDPSDNSIKDLINSQEKERRIQIKNE